MMQPLMVDIFNLSVMVNDVPLLRNVALQLERGGQATLAGPSGSGKSTLLRCLLGFASASSGEIRIGEQLLTPKSIWELRGQMAYVAQEPEWGEDTALDALKAPFAYRMNRHLEFSLDEVAALEKAFLLPRDVREKRLGALSGGEKQRVALIGALLLKRPLLLLDEAASALDGESKKAVRDYLAARADLTILSVSHDTKEFALSGPIWDIRNLSGGAAS